jgi:hypothetical protein
MKKIISISALVLIMVSLFPFSATCQTAKATTTMVSTTPTVEVYYFHFTRRCVTCNAVEKESKAAIAALYPAQFKKGQITFTAVNLDEANSKAAANKCKAEGQALLVVGKGKRVDLTEQGFMYAKGTPEKLKAELKKVIDPLL